MIVDVEDGLTEPPEAVKSKVSKEQVSFTFLQVALFGFQKRVSFKRKFKVQDKESEYEVIEQPKSEDSAPTIGKLYGSLKQSAIWSIETYN